MLRSHALRTTMPAPRPAPLPMPMHSRPVPVRVTLAALLLLTGNGCGGGAAAQQPGPAAGAPASADAPATARNAASSSASPVAPSVVATGDTATAATTPTSSDALPAWVAGQAVPPGVTAERFFGLGQGATLAEAEAQALRAAAGSYWGDVTFAWTPAIARVHATLLAQPELRSEYAHPDGRVTVAVGFTRAAVDARIAEVQSAPEMLALPATPATSAYPMKQVRQAADRLLAATLLGHLCRYRPAIAGLGCKPDPVVTAALSLEGLASRLALVPAHPEGIAYRRQGGPLRPVAVTVVWTEPDGRELAVGSLPVALRRGGAVAAGAVSDAAGLATFALDALSVPGAEQSFTAPAALTVAVDRAALLGPFAELWPEVSVPVTLRELSANSIRVAVDFTETIADTPVAPPVARPELLAALTAAGHESIQLDLLACAAGATDNARLADRCGGAFDVVVRGRLDSVFADRMGGRSVWHEAAADLVVYDAWSGAELARLAQTARAVGLGDEDAGEKALRQLGRALADPVLTAVRKMAQAGAPVSMLTR